MNLNNLVAENNFSVTISLNDLKEFALDMMQQTKRELEDSITAKKSETYVSRQRACEMLDVNATTMWRWAKRNYLVPATVGGKKKYKISDIENLLTN